MQLKKSFIAVGVLLLIVLAAGAVWFFFARKTAAPIQQTTPYQRLETQNSDFTNAEALVNQGQFDAAIAAYQAAMARTSDTDEQGLILYRVADTFYRKGDIVSAVQGMKTVAANAQYAPVLKAYAVQYLGNMYYQDGDPRVTAEIFKDQPYAGFYDSANIDLSYRKLYEYASSFYPLNIAETRIANWYANQIVAAYQNGTPTDPAVLAQIAGWKSVIKEHLNNEHADNTRTQDDPINRPFIATALEREAIIAGKMAIIGDTSFGDPEALFQEAINAHIATGNSPNYDYFFYADYLAKKYGKTRSADIAKLLGNLYQAGYKADPISNPVYLFLANEKKNAFGQKSDIVMLATIDPAFKQLLMSLGWTASDFK